MVINSVNGFQINHLGEGINDIKGCTEYVHEERGAKGVRVSTLSSINDVVLGERKGC